MVENDPFSIAVCDTGPLIHLDELESLSLLSDFQVWVPKGVWKEVELHRPAVLKQTDIPLILKTSSLETAKPTLKTISSTLDLDIGELEALSLMDLVPKGLFFTDDAAARLAAQQLGYKVHGTIGILIRAIRRKKLIPADAIDRLKAIPSQSSLYIRPSLLQEIIELLEKQFK